MLVLWTKNLSVSQILDIFYCNKQNKHWEVKSLPKSKRTATNIEGMNPEKGPSFGADIYDGENEPLTEMQKQHNKNKKKNQ
ncbi:hypothetical protein IPU62_20730 [Pseudogracilibacillus auburnensis]|nr:hypothetical protein [Pseudogracilibacillus auburnensis]